MAKFSVIIFVMQAVFCLFVTAQTGNSKGLNQKLLVISFDSFRTLYLNATKLPWFEHFIKRGVLATTMRSIFPTYTFANHWAIATGKYAENHGIVANYFHDPYLKKSFDAGKNLETYWWNEAEPIWQTARKQGKLTSVAFWPGSAVPFDKGTGLPHFFRKSTVYDPSVPFTTLVDVAASHFTTKKVDFAMIHYKEPDTTGHKAGPDSATMRKELKTLDSYVHYMLDKFDKIGLGPQSLNIIIMGDHGMAQVNREIYIGDYIDMNNIETMPVYGPMLAIWPKRGKTNLILAQLKAASKKLGNIFKAYRKGDLPAKYHYSHHYRIAPIIVVCKLGVYLHKDKHSKAIGQNGYDPVYVEMRPVFMAVGPAFKKGGYRVKASFETKDVYAVMTHVLGIRPPQVGTDACLANVREIFAVAPPTSEC